MGTWARRGAALMEVVVPAAAVMLAVAALVACGKSVDARTSAPTGVSARSVGEEPLPVAQLLRPPVDVPPDLGVQVRRAGPGRYATLVEYHQVSACSQSWSDYASVASVVLELDEAGAARACRGKREAHLAPGDHLRGEAQQGLSGRWSRDGSWVDVELTADDRVCSSHAVGLGRTDEQWNLRCLAVEPDERPAAFAGPVLACRVAEGGDKLGYAVPGVLPEGEWLLLAAGKGLHLRADDDQTALAGVLRTPDGREITQPRLVLDIGRAESRIAEESWRER